MAPTSQVPRVAYFSMEIAIDPSMPTYAGGLGVLAGDTIRAAADLAVPMVAVTLLHRQGYFFQRLNAAGRQLDEPVGWSITDFLEPVDQRIAVDIEGRPVQVRAWRYQVKGAFGAIVPVYLLDTYLSENQPWDRTLTDVLYGGDLRYRLCQEVVLGFGGLKMLRALGCGAVTCFHLNEGHAALVILGLVEECLASNARNDIMHPDVIERVREHCVFTMHTPVPAGHDQFPMDLARRVLGARRADWLKVCGQQQGMNVTHLALRGSRFINGVAMKHGEVLHNMFPGYPIHAITNGVHAATWAAPSFQALYDRHLPDWRCDASSLRHAIGIPSADIWAAHRDAKQALVDHINRETNAGFGREVLTVGFARRATAYKRGALVFHDLERLKVIAHEVGALQLVFAGKAHPQDQEGKEMIRLVYEARDALRGIVPVVYLNNYDMVMARLLCAGVDLWLNTPLPPMEASGTSGMKAAINGVPSLSVLDGWWIEGHLEDVTGWSIGERIAPTGERPAEVDAAHATALYDKLGEKIVPCFYKRRDRYFEIMTHTIALNGAFFNTHRMVAQYLHDAYRLVGEYSRVAAAPSIVHRG